jgi:hypothetical protein
VQHNAYHFTNGYKLRDGTPLPPPGNTLVFEGSVEICRSGYHASRTPWQALKYARGSVLSQVFCDDIVTEQKNDKLVCRRRTIIKTLDIEDLLFEFARKQALSVVSLWSCPSVVKQYLETGDKALRSAARSAAWSAARNAERNAERNAARSAAWSAAWSAARNAERSAAWSAAESAAWSAARNAAESAAWSAAESAAEKMFNEMVEKEFNK